MGLFGLFGKKKRTNSAGEDLNHLTPKGELPYGWRYANKNFTQQLEEEYRAFSNAFTQSKKNGVLAEYASLKSIVIFMEDTAKLCASKGECFVKWASELVADQETLSFYKERLKYLEDNIDDILKKEKIVNSLKKDLKILIEEEPGVLQSDLYKHFDADLKNEISNQLYQMAGQGIIIREKSGRTYKLYKK